MNTLRTLTCTGLLALSMIACETGPNSEPGTIPDPSPEPTPVTSPTPSPSPSPAPSPSPTPTPSSSPQPIGFGVFTYAYDNARTGQNPNEKLLTTTNVNAAQFGKILTLPLDGNSYNQPLYVSSVDMGALGTHNVVFVATEHDSVYAFDADGIGPDGNAQTPLWKISFIDPVHGITPIPADDLGSRDIFPEVGITGTPVIDPSTQTLYVVAKTKENGVYAQRLHAIDIHSGAERPHSPVLIQATTQGNGVGGDGNGTIAFDPKIENQRCALALSHGTVYVSYASHGDNGPYHGWILGYDATTLGLVANYNSSPNGTEGMAGFWLSGGAPAIDANGTLYGVTGNGAFDADTGGTELGDSVIKLNLGADRSLSIADFFTPYNQKVLDGADLDLGSSGVMLIPDQPGSSTHLAVTSGKVGTVYLLDRDNLGKFHAGSNSQIVQELIGQVSRMFATPSYSNGKVYFSSGGDPIKAFSLASGKLSSTPTSQTQKASGSGGTLSISSDGGSNSILWSISSSPVPTDPGILRAYDANDLNQLLYSTQDSARDGLPTSVKFSVPTVANGKVYVNIQGALTVFGLLGN